MKKKIFYSLIVLVLILGIGSYIVAKHMLPYAIIQPPRLSENIHPDDFNLQNEEIDLITKDSVNIKGYWIKNDSIPSKSAVVFVHGIGGCKEHFLALSKNLSKIGVESILMDSRAHGHSGGTYCTYGFKEKIDIAAVVDYIKRKNDSIPIGIWGNSMGGAIAIQALEYDKRIEFGIIESTFTDLRQIVYDYQKSYTSGLGLQPLCNIALNEAGTIAGFNPDAVSPIASVQNIEQPVFMAHGKKDENIKFEYGQLLYDNLKSTQKRFVPVTEGGHFNLGEKGGPEYYQSILEFLNEQGQ